MAVWSSSSEKLKLSEQDVRAALHKLRETATTLGPQARELIAASLLDLDDFGSLQEVILKLDLTTIPLLPE